MATVAELQAQIDSLKAAGKSESNSKSYAKLVTQLNAAKKSPTPTSNGTASGINSDFSNSVQQALNLQQQAIQPAVQSLQSGIQPLTDRYKALLDQIKGGEQRAVEQTTLTQANELGRRGILPSSGIFDQTIERAVNPIREQFAGVAADVGAEQEQGIRAIQNAIAQLQSNAGGNAISNALSLLGLQGQRSALEQSASQFAQNFGLQQSDNNFAQKLFEQIQLPTFQQVTLPTAQAQIKKLLSTIDVGDNSAWEF